MHRSIEGRNHREHDHPFEFGRVHSLFHNCSLIVFPVEHLPRPWWPWLARIDSITHIQQASHGIKWTTNTEKAMYVQCFSRAREIWYDSALCLRPESELHSEDQDAVHFQSRQHSYQSYTAFVQNIHNFLTVWHAATLLNPCERRCPTSAVVDNRGQCFEYHT